MNANYKAVTNSTEALAVFEDCVKFLGFDYSDLEVAQEGDESEIYSWKVTVAYPIAINDGAVTEVGTKTIEGHFTSNQPIEFVKCTICFKIAASLHPSSKIFFMAAEALEFELEGPFTNRPEDMLIRKIIWDMPLTKGTVLEQLDRAFGVKEFWEIIKPHKKKGMKWRKR